MNILSLYYLWKPFLLHISTVIWLTKRQMKWPKLMWNILFKYIKIYERWVRTRKSWLSSLENTTCVLCKACQFRLKKKIVYTFTPSWSKYILTSFREQLDEFRRNIWYLIHACSAYEMIVTNISVQKCTSKLI